jgi:hypothetical protein
MANIEHSWQPIATAPRDGSRILARRVPGPSSPRRKHHEHIVSWDASHYRPVWRSYTDIGRLFQDEHLSEWRPLDLDTQPKLQQRSRNRASEKRKQLASVYPNATRPKAETS